MLNIAKKNGMKVFYTKRKNSCYGWIITKKDNVLYIQRGYFGGYDFSLEYKPSENNGRGCRCNKESVFSITSETFEKMEVEGLNFAKELKANLYKTSEEYFEKYWDKKNLIEL